LTPTYREMTEWLHQTIRKNRRLLQDLDERNEKAIREAIARLEYQKPQQLDRK